MLTVQPIKTRIFHPGQNLTHFVLESVPKPRSRTVIAVTSKLVSLAENRVVPRDSTDKKSLVQKESDKFLGEIGHGCFLTVKHGLLIPSAGIDESNSASGDYILFPEGPYASARKLWLELREAWALPELGIVLTDSRTSPLRRGVTGICLAYWGFKGLRNLIGTPDIFGRELKMTQINLADGLAGVAVMMMGEGKETTPLALIEGAEVEFQDRTEPGEVAMPFEEDLYYPVLSAYDSKNS